MFLQYDLSLIRHLLSEGTALHFPEYNPEEKIDLFLHEYTRGDNPHFPNQIYLHPEKDELICEIPYGRIGKWVYNPMLTCKQIIQTPVPYFHQMELTPDGRRIVFTTRDYSGFHIYDYETLDCEVVIGKELKESKGYGYYCEVFAIHPDGKVIFADINGEYEYTIIDLESKNPETFPLLLHEWYQDDLESLESKAFFIPDRKRLVISVFLESLRAHMLLEFSYIVGQDYEIEVDTLIPGFSWISDLAHSKDGKRLVGFAPSGHQERQLGWFHIYDYQTDQNHKILLTEELIQEKIEWKEPHPFILGEFSYYGYSTKVMIGQKECFCTIPGGFILYFDVETGELLRKHKIRGSKIFAVAPHPTIPNKIRVATDEVIELVDLY